MTAPAFLPNIAPSLDRNQSGEQPLTALTPYTDQGRIRALVTPRVPQVSGYLTGVNVRLHSIVDEGEVLFQIDPRPYELAVQAAEASLDMAAQQVGAQTATVKSATAGLGVARAQLDLAFTSLHAPDRGVIESFNVDVGYYASPGQPLVNPAAKPT